MQAGVVFGRAARGLDHVANRATTNQPTKQPPTNHQPSNQATKNQATKQTPTNQPPTNHQPTKQPPTNHQSSNQATKQASNQATKQPYANLGQAYTHEYQNMFTNMSKNDPKIMVKRVPKPNFWRSFGYPGAPWKRFCKMDVNSTYFLPLKSAFWTPGVILK